MQGPMYPGRQATPRNPIPTVDIIIEHPDGVVLIRRKNPPHGWALPGGFVDYGESLEDAAVREAREETSLDVELVRQFHTYSDPGRDKRFHTLSTVFIARPLSSAASPGKAAVPVAADDAAGIGVFDKDALPGPLCFDHEQILSDYFSNRY